jgi:hypothetical protein
VGRISTVRLAFFGPLPVPRVKNRQRFEIERVEAAGDLVLSVAIQRGSGISSRTPVEWRNARTKQFGLSRNSTQAVAARRHLAD